MVGWIWYHPKIFGNKGTSQTHRESRLRPLALGAATALVSVLTACSLTFIVIHQLHIFSAVMNHPELQNPHSELNILVKTLIEKCGNQYRTFRHGALHGAIAGGTLALPIIVVNGCRERKSAKQILIDVGFWVVCFTLMGGIICAKA
jgi:hypothetical protein